MAMWVFNDIYSGGVCAYMRVCISGVADTKFFTDNETENQWHTDTRNFWSTNTWILINL